MELPSFPLGGIALAVLSALALAAGNLLQARGVHDIQARPREPGRGSPAMRLVKDHSWLLGAMLLVVAIVLQMASLAFAPLMVVQPIGLTALIFTAALTAIVTKHPPTRRTMLAIAVCVVGVAGFVTIAALVSTQYPIVDEQLVAVLVVLLTVLIATGALWLRGRRSAAPPVLWVLLGGIYSAFVATLGKTVILRIQSALRSHDFRLDLTNVLTILCIIGIGVAGVLSIYFVQRAHASNRPDVVVAGLTVVDPAVAVVLGIAILGEASSAPWWAMIGFVIAGACAISGVFALSRAETPFAAPGRKS